MRPYRVYKAKKNNNFTQGFWLGLVSGALGALIVLGRNRN